MIASSVPVRSPSWSGTGTVRVEPGSANCITMWLPRRRTSTNPLSAKIRHSCRPTVSGAYPTFRSKWVT